MHSKQQHDLYRRWHGQAPREERRYNATFASSYGLIGVRAMRLDYISTKLIEDNDAGEPHAYKHDFDPDRKACRIWGANEEGDALSDIPGTANLVRLGSATRLDWLTPDDEVRGLDWAEGSAVLCAIDGRRWCILEPRRHLVTFIGTNSRVTAKGIDDRK